MQTLCWLKKNWLQAVILATPFIVVAAFWGRFPNRVVVQWNDSGPSKWADKFPGLLVCPLVSVALAIVFGWIPPLDPRLRNGLNQGVLPRLRHDRPLSQPVARPPGERLPPLLCRRRCLQPHPLRRVAPPAV